MPPRRAPIPIPLGLPLAPIYRAAVNRRNRRFDRGHGVRAAPIPVISVGNITVGGVGKTPVVQHVARVLKMAGRRPGILLRGYKAEPGRFSDEHLEHKALSPDVPVVSNPSRFEGVAQLLASPGAKPDVVILDDGFQHRRLQRDLDIVLVDVTQNPFEDRLLPAGWLREPVESLARASCVVLTRVDHPADSTTNSIRERVERVTGSRPIAETRHAWAPELQALINKRETTKPVAWLRGKKALVACALGNPASFVNQVRSAGATIADEILLRDHARFTETQVQRIIEAARGVDVVVCTSKDWTKLRRVSAERWPCPIVRPTVQIEVIAGREDLARRIEAAAEPRRRRAAPEQSGEERSSDAA